MSMNRQETYDLLGMKRKNLRFSELCKAAEVFGFNPKARRGSHVKYGRTGIIELLSFQEKEGKAKSYQVDQFLDLVDKYGLLEKE